MSEERRHWNCNEPGILRKKDTNNCELLVFGYSCKLFREDERALQIDQGKHLIPWMGDESLKIDRYDVRGALSDLSKYEGSKDSGGSSWDFLSNEERKVEMLCDGERYRALVHNEDEEALYQEEELKRLHQALGTDKEYGQVSYLYDQKQAQNPASMIDDENMSDDQQEPFVPPAQLDIPANMTIPDTIKQNAIIEKTALFICQQGPQMEILLKMKQAGNRQFEFLSISCPLHSYYRHVLAVIKAGRYKPTLPGTENGIQSDNEEDSYLHPSLLQGSSTLESAPSIPTIAYKPSADCAYSMLVNKIKSKQEGNITAHKVNAVPETETTFEIYRAPVKYKTQEIDRPEIDYSNSATKMISKSSKRRKRKKSFSSDEPVSRLANGGSFMLGAGSYYSPGNVPVMNLYDPEMLVEEPPAELKSIIDKMASYVLRNGRNFEEIVRNKGDPRFSFLEHDNVYNPYYNQLLQSYENSKMSSTMTINHSNLLMSPAYSEENVDSAFDEDDSKVQLSNKTPSSLFTSLKSSNYFRNSTSSSLYVEKNMDDNKGTANESSDENYSANKPMSVCFSIKKPKDTDKLELCSALPMEESSGNEEEKEDEFLKIRPKQSNRASNHGNTGKSRSSRHKRVDNRLRDKLTQVAKDKFSIKEKEKQLQLERKKRAIAFLNHIRKESLLAEKANKKKTDLEVERESPDSSIPSSSSVDSTASKDSGHPETSQSSGQKEGDATNTLKRLLEAAPKDRQVKNKKSRRSSPDRNRIRSKSKKEKHRHHKSHKTHKRNSKDKYEHKSSHKHKHKSKSSKSHKRRRKSGSVVSVSSG